MPPSRKKKSSLRRSFQLTGTHGSPTRSITDLLSAVPQRRNVDRFNSTCCVVHTAEAKDVTAVIHAPRNYTNAYKNGATLIFPLKKKKLARAGGTRAVQGSSIIRVTNSRGT